MVIRAKLLERTSTARASGVTLPLSHNSSNTKVKAKLVPGATWPEGRFKLKAWGPSLAEESKGKPGLLT